MKSPRRKTALKRVEEAAAEMRAKAMEYSVMRRAFDDGVAEGLEEAIQILASHGLLRDDE